MAGHPVLDSLKKDLEYYNDSIKEIALEIVKSGFSKYPVFIAHQHEVGIGEVILDKNDYQRDWTINASILEDLIEQDIILEDKVQEFKRIYKDPQKFICIFLVTENGGNFIFSPYKK